MDTEGRTDGKKVLIVYAHQEPQSYNGSLKNAAVDALESQGYKVTVSDLYTMKFKATTTQGDIEREDNDNKYFCYLTETYSACKRDRMAPDIRDEHSKVRACDLLIMQFPLYWLGMPAIMKGWLDRVLTNGFAHDVLENRFGSRGPLKGKKVLLSLTTGGPAEQFSSEGATGELNYVLWPLQHGFNFCGMDVLPHHVVHNPLDMDKQERVRHIEQYKQRLRGIFSEEPLSTSPPWRRL